MSRSPPGEVLFEFLPGKRQGQGLNMRSPLLLRLPAWPRDELEGSRCRGGALGSADVLQAAGKCCNYQKGAEGQAGRRGCGGEVTAK